MPYDVSSGVPQGTVLGPLLSLCHINHLLECGDSQIRLFANDGLQTNQLSQRSSNLTEDLNNLQTWAMGWDMKFNAKKCYLLSTKAKSSHFYTIDDHILKQVQDNPYLGITISDDQKWKTHITSARKPILLLASSEGTYVTACCPAGRMPTSL